MAVCENGEVEVKFSVFNQRKHILSVPSRWREQYPTDRSTAFSASTGEIQKKLDSLDLSTCDPKEIDKIIGNAGWTNMNCNSCSEYAAHGVEFDNGDNTVSVCDRCLRCAVAVLDYLKKT